MSLSFSAVLHTDSGPLLDQGSTPPQGRTGDHCRRLLERVVVVLGGSAHGRRARGIRLVGISAINYPRLRDVDAGRTAHRARALESSWKETPLRATGKSVGGSPAPERLQSQKQRHDRSDLEAIKEISCVTDAVLASHERKLGSLSNGKITWSKCRRTIQIQ